MAITRERKEELVAKYSEMLRQTDGFILVEYKGLTVKEVQNLRAKIRQASGDYVVTKNTLFRIALEQNGWPVPKSTLNGPVGVVFGKGHFPAVAKVVLDQLKDVTLTEKAKVKGGVMIGSVLNAQQVEAVSNLPTLPELRAQIIGLLVQPATGLVSILNSATGQIVNVLNAYVKEKGGDAA